MKKRGRSSRKSADPTPRGKTRNDKSSSAANQLDSVEEPWQSPDEGWPETVEETGAAVIPPESFGLAAPSGEIWNSSTPQTPLALAYCLGRLINSIGWLLNRSWLDGGVEHSEPLRRETLSQRGIPDPSDEFTRLVARWQVLADQLPVPARGTFQRQFDQAIKRWHAWEREAMKSDVGPGEQLFGNQRAQEEFEWDTEFPFDGFDRLDVIANDVPAADWRNAFELGLNLDRLLRPRAVRGLLTFAEFATIDPADWRMDSQVAGRVLGICQSIPATKAQSDELENLLGERATEERAGEEHRIEGPMVVREADRRILEALSQPVVTEQGEPRRGPLGLWYDPATKVLGRDGRQQTVDLGRSARRQILVELLLEAPTDPAWADSFRQEALLKGAARNGNALRSAIDTLNGILAPILGVKVDESRHFVVPTDRQTI